MITESENSARDRIGRLAMSVGVNWEAQGWVMVRELAVVAESSEDVREGTILQNFEITRAERGIQVGTNSECAGLKNEMVKLGMCSLGGRRWLTRYNRRSECECGWENVDKRKRMLLKINIYKLYFKLLKSHCLFLKYLMIYLCFGWIRIDGIMTKVC